MPASSKSKPVLISYNSLAALVSAWLPFITPNASKIFSHKTLVAFLPTTCDSMSTFLCFKVEVKQFL